MSQNRINVKRTSIFSWYFCFHNLFPSYTNATDTEGVQNSYEWSQDREKQFAKSPDLDINFRFTFYENLNKIKSALRLLESFDFPKNGKIGTIGDSPFVQSIVINDYLNSGFVGETGRGVDFLLTEFETVSLMYGEKLKLKNTEFAEFNLNSDSLELFIDCDIILMWGVDCVVEDSKLLKLFEFCRRNKKILVIASINVERLKFSWKRILLLRALKKTILNPRLGNLHAFLRSQKYFERLCSSVGLKCKVLFADETYRVFRID